MGYRPMAGRRAHYWVCNVDALIEMRACLGGIGDLLTALFKEEEHFKGSNSGVELSALHLLHQVPPIDAMWALSAWDQKFADVEARKVLNWLVRVAVLDLMERDYAAIPKSMKRVKMLGFCYRNNDMVPLTGEDLDKAREYVGEAKDLFRQFMDFMWSVYLTTGDGLRMHHVQARPGLSAKAGAMQRAAHLRINVLGTDSFKGMRELERVSFLAELLQRHMFPRGGEKKAHRHNMHWLLYGLHQEYATQEISLNARAFMKAHLQLLHNLMDWACGINYHDLQDMWFKRGDRFHGPKTLKEVKP